MKTLIIFTAIFLIVALLELIILQFVFRKLKIIKNENQELKTEIESLKKEIKKYNELSKQKSEKKKKINTGSFNDRVNNAINELCNKQSTE